jgi:acyl-coenzyme A synthetase/AMP-(fatty) acid ligase
MLWMRGQRLNRKACSSLDNDEARVQSFTFKDVMENSNRAANLLKSLGIKKGDIVMSF